MAPLQELDLIWLHEFSIQLAVCIPVLIDPATNAAYQLQIYTGLPCPDTYSPIKRLVRSRTTKAAKQKINHTPQKKFVTSILAWHPLGGKQS